MKSIGWGKIILLGEHSVVYGYPALAAALDRGVEIAAVPTPAGGPLRLDIPSWELAVTAARGPAPDPAALAGAGADPPSDQRRVGWALAAIADALRLGLGGFPAVSLVGDAQIPAKAGLGSSAAMAVAVARALLAYDKRPADPQEIAAAAAASEEILHGRPSGVDVAIAMAGGIGVYRKSSGLRPIATRPFRVLIGLSGEPRSTKSMVERVAAATGGEPREGRLAQLGELTDFGTRALLAGDLEVLGDTMNRAHALLADLGVSTPRLDALCAAARAAGAHGAKLTGAGGGGAVLAIAPRAAEADVLAAWRGAGADGFAAGVGGGA